ncbi:predicted protein [Nematostella vectensis]|uniref:Major facilitator superfamily (MFS) profile domain-containing protein n=1 Tax=Nematostella vectensis TaxID=45351 RepID=A7RQQ5_NEMVE|nr:monocarboxylate transporter 10 [Nematostella vectensis]XP_048586814.1 monocarboxylate transporter 10 [Nematostella vectensis]EDO46207.1 predicted protein [Nematostella vectensis]|eukprot:XP_001638270.1 predicted protein [Nematostella vectensis]
MPSTGNEPSLRTKRSPSTVTIENLTAIPVGGSMSLMYIETDNSRSKDRGWAWMVCAGSFLIMFIVYGIHTSFGVLLNALLNHFHESKAKTAWVGSIGLNFLFLGSPVTSRVAERYGIRTVTILGGVFISLGLFLTSYAPNIVVIYITYGLLFGSGTSLCGTMALIISVDYFDKHLSLATGIVAAGCSIGTLVLAPTLQFLVEKLGWRYAVRILAMSGVFIACAGFVYRPHERRRETFSNDRATRSLNENKKCEFFDCSVLRNKAFILWIFTTSIAGFGYFIPHFFLVRYSEDLGIPPSTGSWLISYLGIASAVGRILFGKLSDICCIRNLHIYKACMLLSGLASALCSVATTYGGLITYVVALGILDGSYIGLMSIVTLEIVGFSKISPAWGILFFCQSFTYLLGPPAAGLLYDTVKSFKPVFYLASGPMIFGGVILLFVSCAQTKTQTKTVIETASLSSNSPNPLRGANLTPPTIIVTHVADEHSRLMVDERLTSI